MVASSAPFPCTAKAPGVSEASAPFAPCLNHKGPHSSHMQPYSDLLVLGLALPRLWLNREYLVSWAICESHGESG